MEVKMYKALRSFVGKLSMKKGEVKPIKDKAIANDLLHAGYIIEEKAKQVETKIKEEVKKVKTSKKKNKSLK